MKRFLFVLSAFASVAVSAAESVVDASQQVFGVLPITVSSQSVIVCVPWVASGVGDSNIAVSNLIRTANLTVGDTLKSFDAAKGAFNVWTLAENSGVKYWAGVTVVKTNSTEETSGADVTTLARGGAVILTRGSNWDKNSYTIQVCGQSPATSSGSSTMNAGSSTVPAYTLVAPPSVSASAYNLNSLSWSNLPTDLAKRGKKKGDNIVIGDSGLTYYLDNLKTSNGWGTRNTAGEWVAAPDVSAGIGFWYVSRGGSPTVTW